MADREYHYHWEWRLASPPDALWPLIADTERFNRDTGLPTLRELPVPGGDSDASASAIRRLGFTRLGVAVEWDEQPFEWVAPRSFGVLRSYTRGPLKQMRVRVELQPDGAGTHLTYDVEALPNGALGRIAIPLQIGLVSARDFDRVIRRHDGQLTAARGGGPSATQAVPQSANLQALPEGHISAAGRQRLITLLAELDAQGCDPGQVERLGALLRSGDEVTLNRIRPYALAVSWRSPRRDVLDLFLRATRLGLLDLQWDLLCPRCRGAKVSATALSEVSADVHCDACLIDYRVNFDRQVELTFRVNPAVRVVVDNAYCVGGPRVTPHIAVQQLLAPGEARGIAVDLPAGRYRLRALGVPGGQFLQTAGDSSGLKMSGPAELVTDGASWGLDELVLPTSATLLLRNTSGAPQLLILERLAWTEDALCAAEVTCHQLFRDLFSREVLRPGEQIAIESLTVVFTDLKGSTRMYREQGDGPAFGRVMDHFAVLRDEVDRGGGAVIKTMGDAVVAVFREPAAALAAVLSAQRRLGEGAQPLTLKAGIHSGPCIAVTQNERLDYFGTTMNVAARVQDLSDGSCVVLTAAVAGDPQVAELLADGELSCEPFTATLRGIGDEEHALVRVKAKG